MNKKQKQIFQEIFCATQTTEESLSKDEKTAPQKADKENVEADCLSTLCVNTNAALPQCLLFL